MQEACPQWSPARVALLWQVLDDNNDGKIGMLEINFPLPVDFLKILRLSFPAPVVGPRSLARLCRKKKSSAQASRSWNNLGSTPRQVYLAIKPCQFRFIKMPASFPGPHWMGGRETLGTGYQAAMPEPFHSRGQHLCKCLEKKESVYIRKEFSTGLVWNTKMAACHCFGTQIWPPWRHVKRLYIYCKL